MVCDLKADLNLIFKYMKDQGIRQSSESHWLETTSVNL